jgi:hypothetical protein
VIGKRGEKRHRKVLRDNIHVITKPAIRLLVRRGGVKRIRGGDPRCVEGSLKTSSVTLSPTPSTLIDRLALPWTFSIPSRDRDALFTDSKVKYLRFQKEELQTKMVFSTPQLCTMIYQLQAHCR